MPRSPPPQPTHVRVRRRNNWLLVESGVIDSPSFGTPEALAARKQAMPPAQRWLKVEYQTLRRLPATRGILFTVRTLLEPVTAIGKVPGAAAVLASSMRGMSPELLGALAPGVDVAQRACCCMDCVRC